MVELVGVEEVAGPSSGNDQKHLPIVEKFEDFVGFGCDVGVQHVSAPGAIISNNLAGWQNGQRQNSPGGHKSHEAYVGSVVDGGSSVATVVVQNEGNQTTDDTPHVENAPEDGNVSAFAILWRVGGHDGALRRPEEAGTDSQNGAGDDGEELVLVVVVVQEGAGVEDVGGATCEEGEVGSEDVVDAAAEDTEDCEGGVEGGEGVIGNGVLELAAATHAGEGIEHAGAAKAYQPHKNDLNDRRIVPEKVKTFCALRNLGV